MSHIEDDFKEEHSHIEQGKPDLARVGVLDAAQHGVAATDEKGNALVAIDPVASARLMRKIDFRLVPIVAVLYLFCFIDRANIGNARLAGLERDLKLKGYDYNIVLSAFYVSYVIFEIPANLITKAVGPGKMIPIWTFGFGFFSMCFAFVNSFGAAVGVRFLLGIAESSMLPGIAYYLSRWYTKDELVFRLAMYIVMAPLAGAFGGLLATGFLSLKGFGSIKPWQGLFFYEGIITMGLAIISYFLLTDRPEKAKWLTEEEKALAVARVKAENVAQREVLDKIKWKTVRNGILAPSTLPIALIFLLDNITVQAVAIFTPTIVKTIYPKKTTIQLQLQTVPPYVVGAFMTLLIPYMAWKTKRRGLWCMICAPLMIIGYVIFVATKNPQARYGATFIIMSGAFPFGALCNAWASANVASDASRASAIGTVVMLGNIGGLISTWTFLPSDGPNYIKGNSVNVATSSLIFILTAALLIWMRRDNKKRDQGYYDANLDGLSATELELLGNRHPGFRYRY